MKSNVTGINTKQMQVVRFFNAPVDLVFQMWTNREYLERWWGPENFRSKVDEMDVTEGGRIRITMKDPNGELLLLEGFFKEILAPSKIVFVTSKVDENGKRELEALHTILITEAEGKTKLSLEVRIINLTESSLNLCQQMELGWGQSLDKMSESINLITKKQ